MVQLKYTENVLLSFNNTFTKLKALKGGMGFKLFVHVWKLF